MYYKTLHSPNLYVFTNKTKKSLWNKMISLQGTKTLKSTWNYPTWDTHWILSHQRKFTSLQRCSLSFRATRSQEILWLRSWLQHKCQRYQQVWHETNEEVRLWSQVSLHYPNCCWGKIFFHNAFNPIFKIGFTKDIIYKMSFFLECLDR